MTDGPRRLADLKPGVRLRDAAGTDWVIESVARANSYATPWVHLVADATGARRVEGAGDLLEDWTYI